jgi:bifunctional UDP-N-acetylglucosamine pyrophosphorylase/glucosamine-1-phosphate N-acetyltransferase
MQLTAIVLGAGKGTRMRSDRAKVLHEIAGRPLVGWVLEMAASAGVERSVVVIGHQGDEVAAVLPEGTATALQAEQRGTGDATRIGMDALDPAPDDLVLVLPGDTPLIRPQTMRALVDLHRRTSAAATLLTDRPADPTGYGRIVRDESGSVMRIVEHGDADETELAIDEVNTSVYVFTAADLRPALASLDSGNHQGELYLTDVIEILVARGARVEGLIADPGEGAGINSHDQLAEAAAVLRRRINLGWMQEGVWMQDPDRTYLDASVRLEPGARIYSETHLEGETTVGAGAEIGPSVYARDCAIGAGARVWYSVLRQADVGVDAEVGPYVSLRPGATLLERAKAGTFVEIKNSVVGEGSKVPHLSYVGDTTIGRGSNLGAGTITVNYDGYRKHRTVIGDGVKIGSDTMLVAPVEIGDEAWTGAGTVVTRDVAPGTLVVGRSPTKEIPGYAARRKARSEQERK